MKSNLSHESRLVLTSTVKPMPNFLDLAIIIGCGRWKWTALSLLMEPSRSRAIWMVNGNRKYHSEAAPAFLVRIASLALTITLQGELYSLHLSILQIIAICCNRVPLHQLYVGCHIPRDKKISHCHISK